jgi:hypothetical protein
MYELIWCFDQICEEAYSMEFTCMEALEGFKQGLLEIYPDEDLLFVVVVKEQ